jgi:hypothetical protein
MCIQYHSPSINGGPRRCNEWNIVEDASSLGGSPKEVLVVCVMLDMIKYCTDCHKLDDNCLVNTDHPSNGDHRLMHKCPNCFI